MATDMQIVYVDIDTGRVARIADYTALTCPAELEEFSWQIVSKKMFPPGFEENIHIWELKITRQFKLAQTELTNDFNTRIKLLSDRADCLEQFSRIVAGMRFVRATNMFGRVDLVPMYRKEIDKYKETGEVGELLTSLVDTADDLPIAIAEYEIKTGTYNHFLLASEIQWNKWSRKIKLSTDPIQTMNTIKNSVGIPT
jgi:hypothetical protein